MLKEEITGRRSALQHHETKPSQSLLPGAAYAALPRDRPPLDQLRGIPMQIHLSRNIAAIQVQHAEDGEEQLGVISQLPCGANVDLCGPGFNARTVKVGWAGQYYFVFSEDLREQVAAAGA